MTKITELHRRWSTDADYREAYDTLGEEFDLARALIEARTAARLRSRARSTHEDVAVVYRAIEGASIDRRLERFAQATRTRLRIVFEPQSSR